MEYKFKPSGVCSQMMSFEIDADVVKNVRILGGCSGNTQGVAKLVEGMKVDDVINKLSGIRCGFKGTSCPDQLATAIKKATKK